jgi:hypothetical protein
MDAKTSKKDIISVHNPPNTVPKKGKGSVYASQKNDSTRPNTINSESSTTYNNGG